MCLMIEIKAVAPFTFEGCCNWTVFELWLEFILIPTLKPGQTLVLDNATFHKGGGLLNWWRQLNAVYSIFRLIRQTSTR
ncbi:hypothetical protein AmaxDRAFT_3169 [Limnospira maxima CS-328]|uniref:Tc1-like transposase DDE domain-containing protein n=2 Tax=Limnospira TaxID=2596745 RepID=A0A9P1KLC2_9CYAN|nr:hypothetical protein AmaxDRAFT_3169 [Limnospira maxima CS-328]UWU46189.1 hypothetical protein APLC1_0885 [Arthrospira platensis C1]CDM97878.1 conserved protein of unknown function [Limnospira indica PCC 8005]